MGIFGPIKPLETAKYDAAHSLKKTLSWPHLIALGVGAIVGTGIYTLTGVGAERAGPAVILSFAIAGLVCAFAALAYAEMATLIPTAGSAYTYTYSVMGELLGWIVGWCLVLEYALACSAVAVGWSGHLVGWLDQVGVHFPHILLVGPHAGGLVNLPAVLVVAAIVGLLLLGTRESAVFNIVLVIIKITALGAFVVLTAPHIKPELYHPFMPYGFMNVKDHGVLAAAAIVFFAFFGFDAVSTSAEESKNPGRDLTIGIVGSMAMCCIIYMLVCACAVGAVPFMDFAKSGEPLPYVLRTLGQSQIALWVGGAAIVALPSVILVMMYGQSRIFFVMARDGLLPKGLSKVNKKGVPGLMTIITGLIVAVVAGFFRLDEIAELSNAGTLLAFIAVSASMMVLRYRQPDLKRVFSCPAPYLVGTLAIIGCLVLGASLPAMTLIRFAVWVVIGLCVYFGYGKWNSALRPKK